MADFPRMGSDLVAAAGQQVVQDLQASSRRWGREAPIVPKPTPSSFGPGTDLPPYQLVYELPGIGALLKPVVTHFVFNLELKTAARIRVEITWSGQIVSLWLFHETGPLHNSMGTLKWYTPDEDNVAYDSVDLQKFVKIANGDLPFNGVSGCGKDVSVLKLDSGKPNGLLFHGGTLIEFAATGVEITGSGIGTQTLLAGTTPTKVVFNGLKPVQCDPGQFESGSGLSIKNSSFQLLCTTNVPI